MEQARDRLAKRVDELERLERENLSKNEEKIRDLETQNERIREKMPLRDRVRAIFKKYGFTVFAVASAVALVIGVIQSRISPKVHRGWTLLSGTG